MPDVFRCLRCEYLCAYLTPIAHTGLRVHWAPGIPRALCFKKGENVSKTLGRTTPRRAKVCLQSLGTTPHTQPSPSALCAIAHWSGRSSLPETSAIESISRGVLDAPHARGMTAVFGTTLPVIASTSAKKPHSQLSSSGLTGRSSIPETSAIESTSRGVLDAPHARGMTAVGGCARRVV